MVSGSRFDGGTQVFSVSVRKTIQSIKEIVGNHSDADIYAMLKETKMDPNETTQKLLNQDPFHEVKRRRDKKKENTGYKGSMEPSKHTENIGQGMKSHAFSDRNARRGGYGRNALPGLISREFRIVRDNRVNQNTNRETMAASVQCSTSYIEQVVSNVSGKSSSTGISYDQKHSGARNSDGQKSSHTSNGPSYSRPRHARDANSSGIHSRALMEEMQAMVPNSDSQEQGLNSLDSQPYSATLASNNPVDGLYSSSSDPVHVPSPDSRSSGIVGAIRREVGVVGGRRQSFENSAKHSSAPSSSFSYPIMGKDISASTGSFRPSTAISKNNQLSRTNAPESVMSSTHVSRSFSSNLFNGKPHQQLAGHQKAPQLNMEWKPKSSQKSSLISPGVIRTATTPISPPDDSRDLKTETAQLPEKLSRVNIFENHHVIIPQHLRVSEAERTRLTFGSFRAGFDSSQSFASGSQALGSEDESNGELSASLSVSASAASSEDASGGNQLDLLDDQFRNSGSGSPASAAASEHQLPNTKESASPQNFENYVHIGLARNDSPSYTPAEPQQQQQDPSRLPSFSAYDSQAGYGVPFFKQAMDGNVRGQGLPSPQEALSSHAINMIPATSVPMVQQPVAQLYPQVHVSHFANVMPYRQLLSPVYVPPMAMPGFSSNPTYPHPSNGSNYMLMPGGSSQLTASGLKYGTQQFKPIPAGSPTGFGNYTTPAGYAINTPGAVGGATGLEDSTRFKYKEGNFYIPNPQAETSEIWIQNPRELPGLQSSPYYNIPGQAQPSAYLPSHTGHASFNAAAAVAAQFPGLYHHPTQQATIGNPHHMGGNLGVGVAAATPGAQVGAYQQPQLGHLNWSTNF